MLTEIWVEEARHNYLDLITNGLRLFVFVEHFGKIVSRLSVITVVIFKPLFLQVKHFLQREAMF